MTIIHENLFMTVDHIWFNKLSKILNPNYEYFKKIYIIENDCMKVYDLEKD